MLTWQLDRLVRSATGCFLAAVILAIATAGLTATFADSDAAFGAAVVGALMMSIGGLSGTMSVVGLGGGMFGLSQALAVSGVGWMLLSGCMLFVCVILFDLSITMRRGPLVEQRVWTDTARSVLLVLVLAAPLGLAAWALGQARRWPAVVIPIAIAALGFAMRAAAERHDRRVRDVPPRDDPTTSGATATP